MSQKAPLVPCELRYQERAPGGTRGGSSRRRVSAVGVLGLFMLATVGCNQESAAGSEREVANAQTQGKALFVARCGTCHGEKGKGDGPAAAGLQPRPRDFSDPAWKSKTSAEHLRKVIVGGGTAVGMSPAMPAAPDLKDKPAELDALVSYVQSL